MRQTGLGTKSIEDCERESGVVLEYHGNGGRGRHGGDSLVVITVV